MSFSDDSYGAINESKGTVTPAFENVLSWVVVIHGVFEQSFGPQGSPSFSGAPNATYDHVFVMNATTGKYMMAFDASES